MARRSAGSGAATPTASPPGARPAAPCRSGPAPARLPWRPSAGTATTTDQPPRTVSDACGRVGARREASIAAVERSSPSWVSRLARSQWMRWSRIRVVTAPSRDRCCTRDARQSRRRRDRGARRGHRPRRPRRRGGSRPAAARRCVARAANGAAGAGYRAALTARAARPSFRTCPEAPCPCAPSSGQRLPR
jgi:hypothetical protein